MTHDNYDKFCKKIFEQLQPNSQASNDLVVIQGNYTTHHHLSYFGLVA